MALTEKQAKAQGYALTRSAYSGTTDDRADRWYLDKTDSDVVDRRGPGYPTKRDALDMLEHVLADDEGCWH